MKRTAAALLCLALPCSADRIVELRATTNAPAVLEVPEGKLVTVLGRSYRLGTDTVIQTASLSTITPWETGSLTNRNFDEIGNTVSGPARVTLQVSTLPFIQPKHSVLLREWEPTPAPADTLPVVPAGSGAVLTLETSSDLAAWQPALRTNLPAVGTNRFFRLRLERAE